MKLICLLVLLVTLAAAQTPADLPGGEAQEWHLIPLPDNLPSSLFMLNEATITLLGVEAGYIPTFASFGSQNYSTSGDPYKATNGTYSGVVWLFQVYREPLNGTLQSNFIPVGDYLYYSGASATPVTFPNGQTQTVSVGGSMNNLYYNFTRSYGFEFSEVQGLGRVLTNRTFSFDVLPQSPHARKLHSALVLGNSLVIFGGIVVDVSDADPNNATLSETNTSMIYDIATNTWESMPVVEHINEEDAILPRFGHCAVKLNDTTMLVHGGRGYITPYADSYIFDLTTRSWTQLTTAVVPIKINSSGYENYPLVGVDNGTHITPEFKGRAGHSCHILYDRAQNVSFMFMFGGDRGDGLTNELWALDLINFNWYLVPSPNPPTPRSYFGSAVVDGQSFITWGGWDGNQVVGNVYIYVYNDGFNAPVAPVDPRTDTITNYAVAGGAAGIVVVLSLVVIIVKFSEKKI